MKFVKRNWCTIVAGSYGLVMAVAGYNILTAPFWIGLIAIIVASLGRQIERVES